MNLTSLLFFIAGLLSGFIIARVLQRTRLSVVVATVNELRINLEKNEKELARVREELIEEKTKRVQAETQREESLKRLEEEKKLLEKAEEKLSDTFKALAGDTLNQNSALFIQRTSDIVKPLSEYIERFEKQLREVERNRMESFTQLREGIRYLTEKNDLLAKETDNLVNALRQPHVRGRWGEFTLRRVVELAGMSKHCDFVEQDSVDTEDGQKRPDLIVHLPANRVIVVDSKVSLKNYLDSVEADSEEKRQESLKNHASQMKKHMESLSAKRYWNQFENTPEFVVMFVPGEHFLSVALERERTLIEDAIKNRVIIATPTTLISLLLAVAYGWREEKAEENAKKIMDIGKELYERIKRFAEHLQNIGTNLTKTTEAYNKAVGSLEQRVLPSARKFKELGMSPDGEIDQVESIDRSTRNLSLSE